MPNCDVQPWIIFPGKPSRSITKARAPIAVLAIWFSHVFSSCALAKKHGNSRKIGPPAGNPVEKWNDLQTVDRLYVCVILLQGCKVVLPLSYIYTHIRQIDNCHTSLCAYLKTRRIEPQRCLVRSEQFVTSQHFFPKKKKTQFTSDVSPWEFSVAPPCGTLAPNPPTGALAMRFTVMLSMSRKASSSPEKRNRSRRVTLLD